MHVVYPTVIAVLLFSIGVYGVLARRNAILVLMSVELMLNAVNLNLVAFDMYWRDALHGGQVFALFIITLAAAETGLGLAIVLLVFRNRQTADVDALQEQGERQYELSLAAAPTGGDHGISQTYPPASPVDKSAKSHDHRGRGGEA
jgi:NADH-quinone oxidoreductase subunit K